MIKFETRLLSLTWDNGISDDEVDDFVDFLQEISADDIKFMLEGNIIKQMRPIKITIKRSK